MKGPVIAGSAFFVHAKCQGNAKRLKGGQNTKQLSKSMIEMEGYLRTSAGGISPLMLSSLPTKEKRRIIVATLAAVCLVLSSDRDSDILT